MAWTSIVVVSTGELAAAAVHNDQVLGNLNHLHAGGLAMASQAALDFIFPSSATQLARLAKGTALQAPRINAGVTAYEFGSPVWTPTTTAFTPTITASGGASGQTYATQVGRYVQLGQFILAYGQVALTAKGTLTGTVQIGGLPATILNVAGCQPSAVIGYWGAMNFATADVRTIFGVGNVNAVTINLYYTGAAATDYPAALATLQMTNTSGFFFSLAYLTA